MIPKRRIIDENICANVSAIVYRNTHIDSKYGSEHLILDQISMNPKKRFATIKPKNIPFKKQLTGLSHNKGCILWILNVKKKF
ncbi:MAG: hypothetical protein OMM_08572 [Candidatus Magnetoglobus multicellularis str. Araruama]|uniref:Uncharacterized protein n=1 Tax=Candidatus Magnetoglobus multicellularis str. Araruama TaxID=890399 RepID=A0A1V1P7K0_9BACT|nr:MAG: hypothetical protein OMM_08572 [Candidatus Magnetoglobus multicellularis str. Araruama]